MPALHPVGEHPDDVAALHKLKLSGRERGGQEGIDVQILPIPRIDEPVGADVLVHDGLELRLGVQIGRAVLHGRGREWVCPGGAESDGPVPGLLKEWEGVQMGLPELGDEHLAHAGTLGLLPRLVPLPAGLDVAQTLVAGVGEHVLMVGEHGDDDEVLLGLLEFEQPLLLAHAEKGGEGLVG